VDDEDVILRELNASPRPPKLDDCCVWTDGAIGEPREPNAEPEF
jgi:hypothetical protein